MDTFIDDYYDSQTEEERKRWVVGADWESIDLIREFITP